MIKTPLFKLFALLIIPYSLYPSVFGNTAQILHLFAKTLNETKQNHPSQQEKYWSNQIEAIRFDFAQSNGKIGNIPMTRIANHYSLGGSWTFLLMRLIENFKPKVCLEIGTCIGISAAYIGGALTINGKGQLVTLENINYCAQVARDVFERLELDNTTVLLHKNMPYLVKQAAQNLEPIDFVFEDHFHSKAAVIRNMNLILPHCGSQTILLLDDIARNGSMHAAWQQIKQHPRVKISLAIAYGVPYPLDVLGRNIKGMPRFGICIIDDRIQGKSHSFIDLALCDEIIVKDNKVIGITK